MKRLVIIFLSLLASLCAVAQSVPTNVPTSGLVAYYGLDGNGNDLSGNGNNGVLEHYTGASNPQATADRHGTPSGALLFGGPNNMNWVKVANSSSLQFTSQMTISFWMKQSSGEGHFMDTYGELYTVTRDALFAVIGKGGVGNPMGVTPAVGRGLVVHTSLTSEGSQMVLFETTRASSTSTAIGVNSEYACYAFDQWIHVALTVEGNKARIYFNGVLYLESSLMETPDYSEANSQDLYFGRLAGGDYPYYAYNGALDDIAIYNRAIDDDEVKQLYNAYRDPLDNNAIEMQSVAVTNPCGSNYGTITLTPNALPGTTYTYALGTPNDPQSSNVLSAGPGEQRCYVITPCSMWDTVITLTCDCADDPSLVYYDSICPGETGTRGSIDEVYSYSFSSLGDWTQGGDRNWYFSYGEPNYSYVCDEYYYGYYSYTDCLSSPARRARTTTSAYFPTYWGYIQSYTGYLISPAIEISCDPSRSSLTFYYMAESMYENYSSGSNTMKLYYSTSQSGPWTQLWSSGGRDVDSWTQVNQSLSMLPESGTYYFKLESSGAGYQSAVDDFTVYCDNRYSVPAEVSAAAGGSTVRIENTLENTGMCPLTEVTLWYVKPETQSETTAYAANSYYWAAGTRQTYTSSGDYTYNNSGRLKNALGCDSTAILHLTIDVNNRAEIEVTACNEYTWSANGVTYTTSAIDSVKCMACNAFGGDSTTVLTLTINPSYPNMQLDTQACGSLWMDGTTYTQTTTLTQNLRTVAGHCDSIVHTTITIHPTYLAYDTIEQCYDETSTIAWRHTVLPAGMTSGNYALDTFSIHGCDSNFMLNLILHGSVSTELQESTIENALPHTYDTYTFYHAVNDTAIHYTDQHGCDSIVAYTLTVYMNVTAEAYDTVCYSDLPHQWNGETFAAADLDDPASLAGEIAKQTTLLTVMGADSLLTMHLRVNPTYITANYDTVCANSIYSFGSEQLTFRPDDDTTLRLDDTLSSAVGCDSLASVMLRVYPTYALDRYDTMFQTELPIYYGGHRCDGIGDYSHDTVSRQGCDSITTLHLWVNQLTHIDTAVCSNDIPITWRGHTYGATSVDTTYLVGMHGEDSLVVSGVTIIDTSASYDYKEACERYVWQDGRTYTATTDAPYVVSRNSAGCDSVVHLRLTIWPTGTGRDSITACDSYTWSNGVTYESSVDGLEATLQTVHGCDSTVSLLLKIYRSSYDEYFDSLCLGSSYTFRGHTYNRGGTYFDTMRTAHNCDSVGVLNLVELSAPTIQFSYERNCHDQTYAIELESGVDYLTWTSYPADPTLEGQEHASSVIVRPVNEVTYTIYADYRELPTCPGSVSFSLSPLKVPQAVMRTSPDFLTIDQTEITAYDLSLTYDSRNWYVNGLLQDNHDKIFRYESDASLDSVRVMLEVIDGFCRDSTATTFPIYKPRIFAPNVFTPYLSNNNVFKVHCVGIEEFEMTIYNRQGLQVFHTEDMNEGWDGKKDDVYCPQGAYVYIIRYRDATTWASAKELKGTITLLR